MAIRDGPVLVERVIAAPAPSIFELLATPARHAAFDGSAMLRGVATGPDRLSAGALFSVRMRRSGVDYRTTNEVVEFVEDRRIAWRTSARLGGRTVLGGQVWRYVLLAHGDHTLVRHEYDWRASNVARLLLLGGYPARMQPAMTRSLQALDRLVTGLDGGPD